MSSYIEKLQWEFQAHHLEQFGEVPLWFKICKLSEESGEVMGALVRHAEGRDDRSWLPDIAKELRDVLNCVLAIQASLELDMEDEINQAVTEFCGRKWSHAEWGYPSMARSGGAESASVTDQPHCDTQTS